MRLLAVLDGTGTGGAETSMAAMAPLLLERGVELEVAYFHERAGAREKFLEAGVPLLRVRPGRSRVATMWRLRRLIQQRRPHLIHTMIFEADLVGRTAGALTRTPVLSSIINEMYGPEQIQAAKAPWKMRAAQVADIATARFVTQFHAISHTAADIMAPRLRIDRSKIAVVYRGRNSSAMGSRTPERRSAVRETLGLAADMTVILAVGRHEPQKGLDVALKALPVVLAADPRTILLVAGREGSATAQLLQLVDELDLGHHVRILGHRPDVPDLLVAADVMVFPSRWEGLGGTLIEAMALGCPLVCSDLPVLREVTSAETSQTCAHYFPPGDHVRLAASLQDALRLTDETEVRRTIGQQIYERRYDLSEVTDAYIALIHKAVEAYGRAREPS